MINLGAKDARTGLTFISHNKAKRTLDILIQPMPFDRLNHLGNSPSFQVRLVEEARLKTARRPIFIANHRRAFSR